MLLFGENGAEMSRGAKRDIPITKLLHDNGLLGDKRSFVSLGAEPHLYLRGEDITNQRNKVWYASKGRCAICKMPMYWDDWHMDHLQGGLVGRCDDLNNLRAVHPACHRGRHVQVQLKSMARVCGDDPGTMG